jgi:tetratricopeptide (TPR) repeat protein
MFKNYFVVIFIITIISCDSNSDSVLHEIDGDLNMFFESKNDIENSEAKTVFNKGLMFVQKENFMQADSLFFLADKLEPNNAIILNAIALNAYYLKNRDKAYDIFNQIIKLDKSFSHTYSNYAFCLNKDGDFHKAVDILNEGFKYVNNVRTRGTFYYTFSISYLELNNCKLAIENIDKAIEISDNERLLKKYRDFKEYIQDKCRE